MRRKSGEANGDENGAGWLENGEKLKCENIAKKIMAWRLNYISQRLMTENQLGMAAALAINEKISASLAKKTSMRKYAWRRHGWHRNENNLQIS